MKAILVIDMPNECANCPCYNDEYSTCSADGRKVGAFSPRIDWCPLKPIPMKRTSIAEWFANNKLYMKTYEITEYDKGWNDCVVFLEGGEYD